MALALPLAAGIAYAPVLRAGYIWDDDTHVTRPDLRSLAGLRRIWTEPGATAHYNPILNSAFWAEHRLWGDSAQGYHALNLALHAGVAFLLFLLLRRLAVPGAARAAAAGDGRVGGVDLGTEEHARGRVGARRSPRLPEL
jgi:hypothetical protein